MKKFSLFVLVAMVSVFLSGCASAQGAAQTVVELPNELQAAIGLGVLYLVGLALSGKLPTEYVMEIAAAITVGIVTIAGVLLRLIPLEFEPVARAILNLIVVLLGGLQLVRGLFIAFGKRQVAQKLRLLN